MNKSISRRVVLILAAVFVLSAAVPVLAQGNSPWAPPRPNVPVVTQPITAEESAALAFMREEEKLARDVYRALFEEWKLTVFDRIADSEQRHFDSVGALLKRYGIEDPARTDVPGVFVNTDLTALYAELMAKAKLSAKDALEVGVLIEKTDIEDLEAALAATTKLDVKRVYSNLLNGSLNHQEAFETNLEAVCLNQ